MTRFFSPSNRPLTRRSRVGLAALVGGAAAIASVALAAPAQAATDSRTATTTTLTQSSSTSLVGTQVKFTVKVNTATYTPAGGTVNVIVDGTRWSYSLGDGNVLGLTLSLTPGTHSLSARYLGDATFAPSASATLTHTVVKAGTTTSIIAPTGVALGTPMAVQVKVASVGSGATPTGTVSLSTPAGVKTATLASGTATFVFANPAKGSYTLTATYAGSGTYAASSKSFAYTVF